MYDEDALQAILWIAILFAVGLLIGSLVALNR